MLDSITAADFLFILPDLKILSTPRPVPIAHKRYFHLHVALNHPGIKFSFFCVENTSENHQNSPSKKCQQKITLKETSVPIFRPSSDNC